MIRQTTWLSLLFCLLYCGQTWGYGAVTAEDGKVVFSHAAVALIAEGDSVSAHIKIRLYLDNADASKILWLIPVPSGTRLIPSHNQIFDALEQVTRPSYRGNWANAGEDPSCDGLVSAALFPIADRFPCISCPSVDLVNLKETGPVAVELIGPSIGEVRSVINERGFDADRVLDVGALEYYAYRKKEMNVQ